MKIHPPPRISLEPAPPLGGAALHANTLVLGLLGSMAVLAGATLLGVRLPVPADTILLLGFGQVPVLAGLLLNLPLQAALRTRYPTWGPPQGIAALWRRLWGPAMLVLVVGLGILGWVLVDLLAATGRPLVGDAAAAASLTRTAWMLLGMSLAYGGVGLQTRWLADHRPAADSPAQE